MPEDSAGRLAGARSRTPAGARAGAQAPVGGIERDEEDVRDRFYEPTLARLAPRRDPDPALVAALRDAACGWGMPRVQGDEGTCGGQALAALVDIERIGAGVPGAACTPASARMIYQCALLRGGREGVSLRDVIKAFYNYGVCSNTLWPYEANGDPGALTVEIAQDARQLSLGAYYRLRPTLNLYHAALNETGALLVSAELHDGWLPERVQAAKGEIVPLPPNRASTVLQNERHAFLVVGYTPAGFLVLNSWGRDWGGWTAEDGGRVPGVALWRYADWADTILDGWVLRLGVGAADAFDFSIGEQGLGAGAQAPLRAAPVRSTPVHAILGNFLHLDDGDFVEEGAFVSTGRTLRETQRLLEEDARSARPYYHGILLTFAGALQGLRDATDTVARRKRQCQTARWHPFTVLWCVDYVEQVQAVLDGVLREAATQTGQPGAALDRLVETRAHGIGRAVWRDIRRAADRSARPEGPLHGLARAGAALAAARPGFEAAGGGGVRGGAGARRPAVDGQPGLRRRGVRRSSRARSVDLVAPPMSAADAT